MNETYFVTRKVSLTHHLALGRWRRPTGLLSTVTMSKYMVRSGRERKAEQFMYCGEKQN